MELDTIPELEAGVLGLALVGRAQMLDPANRGVFPPNLLESRIRYQREPPGEERWQTPLQVARTGSGDCEDLSAFLAAQILSRDPQFAQFLDRFARPRVLAITPQLRHVVVALADGRLVDPSKLLGMKGRG